MKIEQIYTGCLAQGAYYITSANEAVVIDPLREITPYIDRARKDNVSIRYVFETHFHADFVSGHIDLAKSTGASIIYGPGAVTSFESTIAKDGDQFKVGDITFEVIHTPGHTMESTCYLLRDENGKPVALFTGDTLFIGDVGRPDLAQKSSVTQDDLAGMLFDSLRNKILTLPDNLIIYPAHGAGSACGKNMSSETHDTLGNQKQVNYALNSRLSKQEFIREVTDGLLPPPGYFPLNVQMNREGYENIQHVVKRGKVGLSPAAFETAANETGALILDTRTAEVFAKAFIPNAVNIGIDGTFAPWAGALITDVKQELLIISDPGREEEVITRLARVGFDHVAGYLEGGLDAWIDAGKETDAVPVLSAEQFSGIFKSNPHITVLDVRKPGEYESGHLPGAVSAPLDFLNESMIKTPKNEPVYIHCQSGYRSMIYASALRARGYQNIIDIKGGFKALRATNLFTIETGIVSA